MAGMKLDTRNGKRTGLCGAVLRAVWVAAGLAGIVTSSLADDFAGLADPTQPLYGAAVTSTQRPTGSALQSTFVSASQRRAVINGRTYRVGDKFGGGMITDIQPYEVVVKQANRETRLRLLPKLAKETHLIKVPANSQEGSNEK
jgi:hypothetical protein